MLSAELSMRQSVSLAWSNQVKPRTSGCAASVANMSEIHAALLPPASAVATSAMNSGLAVRARSCVTPLENRSQKDVQVLHGFDTADQAKAYLKSALFAEDIVTALRPLLDGAPEIRIYQAA